MFAISVFESLESRRLYFTDHFDFSFDSEHLTSTDQGVGPDLIPFTVTATAQPHGDTATITVSGLPDHKMYRAWHLGNASQARQSNGLLGEDGGEEGNYDGQESGGQETGGQESGGEEHSGEEASEEAGEEGGNSVYRWEQHSGTTLTYEIFTGDEFSDGGEESSAGTSVDIWQPTVAISSPDDGNPSTTTAVFDESDGSNHPFTVTRDEPSDYRATMNNGNQAIPSVTVQLQAPSGTATEGTDYETIARSVVISGDQSSKQVAFKIKNDLKPEGYDEVSNWPEGEDVYLRIQPNKAQYDTFAGPFGVWWGAVHIEEDLHWLSWDEIKSNASVQSAIDAAWNGSNPDGALSGKIEQGFGIYYSLKTGDLSTRVIPRMPDMAVNELDWAPFEDPSDRSNILISHMHITRLRRAMATM